MSAIAGLYNLNNQETIAIEHRNGMMKTLEKFPADDIQVWQKGPVFLGCHAQWITPESIGEQLPFYDSERKCAITADCIIDNREELFEALQIPREDQKTIPDSLLILLAYYKWGEDCPKHLIGDFAFMIWDEKERKMFGARDFSGTRTLYYFNNGKQFGFCSVILPFFTLPSVRKLLNEEWLAEYLVINGMIDAVNSHLSPYKNINQVPPSHSFTLINGKISFRRYSYIAPRKIKLKSNEEYVEAFVEVFQKAVCSRTRTHLNVGAQLSGGLDSGSVVGYAVKKLKEKNQCLHTFSYIPPKEFKDFTPSYLQADESPFIRQTVEYVGGIKDHYLDFDGKDSYSEINDFLELLEMPYKFFENSFWLKGMFEAAKKEKVGILLNGDRGNFTVSWGFPLDFYATLLKKFKWIRLFKELDGYSQKVAGPRFRSLPLIVKIGFPILEKMLPSDPPINFSSLINPEFANKTKVYEKLKENGIEQTGWYSNSNIFFERRKHFTDVFQWNGTNTLASKFSLKYGVWKRDPTNDLRVVQFCLSVPEDQYVQNGMDRALIRKATKNILPNNVRLNQEIRGVQGVDWVYRMLPKWEILMNEVEEMSKDNEIANYLDMGAFEKAKILIQEGPKIENATNPYYKILLRSVIINRFVSKVSS